MARRLAAGVLAGLILAVGAAGAQPDARRSVNDLMKFETNPAAEYFWSASGVIDTPEGSQDLSPADAQRWRAVGEAAETVRDNGRDLLTAAYLRPEPAWRAAAEAMIAGGEAGVRAATARDPDAAFAAGGQMNDACRACHYRFAKRRE